MSTMTWGTIDGVSIEFPVEVGDMNSATLTWDVPLDAAAELVPGDAFEVTDMGGGTAMLVMALCDYRDNPWGDYDEVNFGLMAHPRGRPEELGAFVWRMPVNQEFTCRAGNEVMGLPKTLEDLRFSYTDNEVHVSLSMGGRRALEVWMPRPAVAGEAVEETTSTFSYLDGVPTAIPLTVGLPTGLVDPAAVRVELGDAEVADELRRLGLPRPPQIAMWGEGLRGTFGVPRRLEV